MLAGIGSIVIAGAAIAAIPGTIVVARPAITAVPGTIVVSGPAVSRTIVIVVVTVAGEVVIPLPATERTAVPGAMIALATVATTAGPMIITTATGTAVIIPTWPSGTGIVGTTAGRIKMRRSAEVELENGRGTRGLVQISQILPGYPTVGARLADVAPPTLAALNVDTLASLQNVDSLVTRPRT
ncbi:MAG TPA: hypothetical protein VGM83_17275 [Devosiaceae bacterium]